MVVETIVLAVIAAIMYAGTMFLKKNMDPEKPQEFDGGKFGATIVIGAGVGLVFGYSGIIPSESAVVEQLVAYSGATAIIENGLKIGWRWYNGVTAAKAG